MEYIATSVFAYLLFGIPAFVAGALGWFLLRKYVHVRHIDWLLLVLPWLVWFALMLFAGSNKSLSNLGEAFYLGCITAALFVARLGLSAWLPRRQLAFGVLALVCSCVAAVSLWAFVPALPE